MSRNNRTVFVYALYFLGPWVISAQGHYPLEIGNIWEYRESPNYYAWTMKAVGDTVMPNGHRYVFLKKMETSFGLEAYLRQDGSKVHRYLPSLEGEELLFDFSKITGDTVSVYSREGETVVTTVLEHGIHDFWGGGRRFWIFLQEFLPTTFYRMWEVTDSLGLTHYQIEPGDRFFLRGAVIRGRTYGMVTGVVASDTYFPKEYQLYQNYPNPFNNSTIIRFETPERERILMRILDGLGRSVVTLVDGVVPRGPHAVSWDGRNNYGSEASSGIYICELKAENMTSTIKIMVVH